MLFEFITANRRDLIARTQIKVARRLAPRPTEQALASGVPLFLDQLAETLRWAPAAMPEIMKRSAEQHGAALLGQGYTIGQVVHDYGDVCQAITELACETEAAISTDEFHMLNLCLDEAIADAVTEYSRVREQSMAEAEAERSRCFARELRNDVSAAQLSLQVIRGGRPPVQGIGAAIITRSMQAIAALVSRVLVDNE